VNTYRAGFAAFGIGLGLALSAVNGARAAELKILSARAIATVLDKIGPQFEKETGNKLNVVVGLAPGLTQQINSGEPFDIFTGQPGAVDALIKDGKLNASTRTNLARAVTGVEVRAGSPKPDISSVEAFKRAVLAAKSVGYLKIAGVPQLMDRLGLTDAIKSKVTVPDTDVVSEMVTTPGVELVGPLPSEIQIQIPFAGAVSAQSKSPDAAAALLKLLTGPAAISVIKAQGMEPG
jgi:molybdate transport system substrate-binding protein